MQLKLIILFIIKMFKFNINRLLILLNILVFGYGISAITERYKFAQGIRNPELLTYPPIESWGGDLFLVLDHFNIYGLNEIWYSNSYFIGSGYLSASLLILNKLFDSLYVTGLIYYFLCLIMFSFIANRNLKNYNASLLLTSSLLFIGYPGFISFHTLNYDLFVIIVLFIYFEIFNKYRFLSIVLISLISLIKIWPIIFFIFSLDRRRVLFSLKQILILLATLLIEFMVAFLAFGKTVSYDLSKYIFNFTSSVKLYEDLMVLSGSSLNYTTSLINCIQNIHFRLYDQFYIMNSSELTIVKFALLFMLVVSCILAINKLEDDFFTKILLLMSATILFFPTSGDYKLFLFSYPILLLMNNKKYSILFLLICLLMIPKPYFPKGYTNLASIVNPIIVMIIYLYCFLSSFKIFRLRIR